MTTAATAAAAAPTVAATAAAAPRAAVATPFRDLEREHGFEPLRLEGRLPEALAGTLYRTGPALFSSFGRRYAHWFDGDGAVSAVRFAGGRASGAVKLVLSKALLEERAAQRALYGGYGSVPPGLRRFFPRVKNAANTAMLALDGRVLALFEAGLPTEISADDLSTLGERDLGAIPATFSAHPHAVPARNAIYNFGVRYGRRCQLDIFAMQGGTTRLLTTLPIPMTMVHDFVATERHLVFFLPPLRLRALRLLMGFGSLAQNLVWRPELGGEVIIVPIDEPTRVTRFAVEPFFTWHFINAHEAGDQLVVDLVRYPDFASNGWLGTVASAQPHGGSYGTYHRAWVDPARAQVRFEQRSTLLCEFPRVAPAREGRRAEVAWVAETSPAAAARSGLPDGLARLELEHGRQVSWQPGGGQLPSEPIFVPRPGASPDSEDDGWVLSLVYDPGSDSSHVAVLDGRDLAAGPLARVHFDHHIPLTFHGTFVPAQAPGDGPAPRR